MHDVRLGAILVLCVALAACSDDQRPPRRDGGAPAHDSGTPHTGWDAGPPIDAAIPRADATCERIDVAAEAGTVNVLILLDRSGSMYMGGVGTPSVDRWNPAVMAINAATTALQDRVDFGLMLFPSDASCGAGTVTVPVASMNASAIAGALSGDPMMMVRGGTPIAATLRAARAELASLEGDSYVLLVTDGAPNCASGQNGFTCRCTGGSCLINALNCLDDTNAVAAVQELAAAGIGTYVIGYDTGEWVEVLDRMASAGGTGNTAHFPVGDQASLETALRDIAGSVVSCTYELAMPPGDIRYVRVTVDGTDVPHESASGDGSGWVLEGDRTVTLVGSACDSLKDGAPHDIGIVVECEPVLW